MQISRFHVKPVLNRSGIRVLADLRKGLQKSLVEPPEFVNRGVFSNLTTPNSGEQDEVDSSTARFFVMEHQLLKLLLAQGREREPRHEGEQEVLNLSPAFCGKVAPLM